MGPARSAGVYFRQARVRKVGSLNYRKAARYVPVAAVADVPPGTMRTVEVDDWRIVVVNVDGEFFAYDSQCPHLGGPLDKGRLDDGALVCPWHGWRFDARTGRPIWPQGVWKATRFPVAVEDGQVLVRVA